MWSNARRAFRSCTKAGQGAQRGEDGDVAGGVAQSKRDGQSWYSTHTFTSSRVWQKTGNRRIPPG